MSSNNGGDTLTEDDIATMNGMAVARVAAFARIAGTVLVAVGVVGAAAWLWLSVRVQQQVSDIPGGSAFGDSQEASFSERVDILANYFAMAVWAALAAGTGFALRLVADYAVARTGGSLTGFGVGDDLVDESTDA